MGRAVYTGVTKRFDGVDALVGVDLDVGDGELLAILGPSGCGKSTLLRVTAGLEPLSGGTITLDGRRIDDLAPQARDVAMVFQSYALYPHLTVAGNIEFPLRMRRVPRAERRRRVAEVAALLELTPLLDRRPAALSGGQRQRVALARALVREPALFLLDEPLSNVDARLRTTLRRWIRDVQRRLRATMLYVTHDQTEALAIGDRIALFDRGRLQQVDTPLAVYERPATTFVAGFVGTPPMNLVPAVRDGDVVVAGGQRLPLPAALRARLGDRGTIGARPEAFAVGRRRCDGLVVGLDPATREPLGSETLVRGRLGEVEITVRLPGLCRDVPPQMAAPVQALHVFAADGRRIGCLGGA